MRVSPVWQRAQGLEDSASFLPPLPFKPAWRSFPSCRRLRARSDAPRRRQWRSVGTCDWLPLQAQGLPHQSPSCGGISATKERQICIKWTIAVLYISISFSSNWNCVTLKSSNALNLLVNASSSLNWIKQMSRCKRHHDWLTSRYYSSSNWSNIRRLHLLHTILS